MALLKCKDCQRIFWSDHEAQFCPICKVIEKSKQLAEKPPVAARTTPSRKLAGAAL